MLVFAAAAAVVAVMTVVTLFAAESVIALNPVLAVIAVLLVPGEWTEETVAAAAGEEYDEAFAVFPGSTGPGSGDRCL